MNRRDVRNIHDKTDSRNTREALIPREVVTHETFRENKSEKWKRPLRSVKTLNIGIDIVSELCIWYVTDSCTKKHWLQLLFCGSCNYLTDSHCMQSLKTKMFWLIWFALELRWQKTRSTWWAFVRFDLMTSETWRTWPWPFIMRFLTEKCWYLCTRNDWEFHYKKWKNVPTFLRRKKILLTAE